MHEEINIIVKYTTCHSDYECFLRPFDKEGQCLKKYTANIKPPLALIQVIQSRCVQSPRL